MASSAKSKSYNTFSNRSDSETDNVSDSSGQRNPPSPGSSSQTDSPSQLPVTQLFVLAVVSLAEQTAMNNMSPYLPQMVMSFPEVESNTVGMYVGLLASAFALAQCTSGYLWGLLSDWIGRKPVIMLGMAFAMLSILAFGFCTSIWTALAAQAAMGLLNGNAGVVSTCLGELTDKSNQGKAFTYLPVVYGIGSVTGPAMGGFLVQKKFQRLAPIFQKFPFLLPNLCAATVLLVGLVVCVCLFDECLGSSTSFFSWIKSVKRHLPFQSNNEPTGQDGEADTALPRSGTGCASRTGSSDETATPEAGAQEGDQDSFVKVFTRDTVLILLTYLLFSFSNVAYAAIFPVFAATEPPTGRDLSPQQIGFLLSFSGIVAIFFQMAIYGKVRSWAGNRLSYRASQVTMGLALLVTPWVGYKHRSGSEVRKASIWIEFGVILIFRTVASVGGLTSALLLITNSAPCPAVLGRLNGLAQTLSAAGRAVAPIISGSLFSFATRIPHKGELLPFTVLAGISFLGFVLSCGIRSPELEDEEWEDQNGEGRGDEEDARSGERDSLLGSDGERGSGARI